MRASRFRVAVLLIVAGYVIPLAAVGAGVALLTGLDAGDVGVVGSSLGAGIAAATGVGVALLALGLVVARRDLEPGASRARARRLMWATLPGFAGAAALLYQVSR